MKKYIVLMVLGAITIASGCSKQEAAYVDVQILIHVFDYELINLLDPSNPTSYPHDGIKTYYNVDNEWIEYYNQQMDAPRGFHIREDNGFYYMQFFGYTGDVPKGKTLYPSILIKWNEQDSDVVEREYDKKPSYTYCTKVWLNGELVWENGAGLGPMGLYREITIIK